MRRRSRAALSLQAVVLAATSVLTQVAPSVPLSGSVRDAYRRDGFLSGATVVVTNNLTGATVTLVTDRDGTFSLPTIDPGTYTIAISVAGYGSLVASNSCVVSGKPAVFRAVLGPDRGRPTRTAASADATTVTVPMSAPSHGALTTPEIEAAIAFGRQSKIEAYKLQASRGLERHRLGSIFTPFSRIAIAARVAATAKKSFTASEIPAAFVEKLAWVVGHRATFYRNDSDMDSPQYLIGVHRIVVRPHGSKDSANDIQPVWKMYLSTECDVNLLESVLGDQFSRPGIVAAFPMDAVRAGNTILFTYSTNADPADGVRGLTVKRAERRMVITEKQVREWK